VGFEFREALLDRIEVGRIRRQVAQFGAGGLDDLPHHRVFVRRQIVHHDDVAGRQSGHQALTQIRDKDRRGHRLVDRERCGDRVVTQGGDERHGLPMAARHAADDALTSLAAAAQAGHGGRGAGLVNEHQPPRLEPGLFCLPRQPRRGHVRPLLFAGVHDFF